VRLFRHVGIKTRAFAVDQTLATVICYCSSLTMTLLSLSGRTTHWCMPVQPPATIYDHNIPHHFTDPFRFTSQQVLPQWQV